MTNEKQIDKICRMLDDLITKSKRDTNSEPVKEQLKSPDFYKGYKIGFESAQPKWISVEERLPEHGEVVMVFAKVKPDEEALLRDLLSFASYWCDDGWVVDFIDDTDDITVTHWMPLPSTEEIE